MFYLKVVMLVCIPLFHKRKILYHTPMTTSRSYGHFDDTSSSYTITDPDTPQPWVNYLSNGRLVALLSNQAGGLCFLHDPQTRRLTRYHWLSAPADRPGFHIDNTAHETGSTAFLDKVRSGGTAVKQRYSNTCAEAWRTSGCGEVRMADPPCSTPLGTMARRCSATRPPNR